MTPGVKTKYQKKNFKDTLVMNDSPSYISSIKGKNVRLALDFEDISKHSKIKANLKEFHTLYSSNKENIDSCLEDLTNVNVDSFIHSSTINTRSKMNNNHHDYTKEKQGKILSKIDTNSVAQSNTSTSILNTNKRSRRQMKGLNRQRNDLSRFQTFDESTRLEGTDAERVTKQIEDTITLSDDTAICSEMSVGYLTRRQVAKYKNINGITIQNENLTTLKKPSNRQRLKSVAKVPEIDINSVLDSESTTMISSLENNETQRNRKLKKTNKVVGNSRRHLQIINLDSEEIQREGHEVTVTQKREEVNDSSLNPIDKTISENITVGCMTRRRAATLKRNVISPSTTENEDFSLIKLPNRKRLGLRAKLDRHKKLAIEEDESVLDSKIITSPEKKLDDREFVEDTQKMINVDLDPCDVNDTLQKYSSPPTAKRVNVTQINTPTSIATQQFSIILTPLKVIDPSFDSKAAAPRADLKVDDLFSAEKQLIDRIDNVNKDIIEKTTQVLRSRSTNRCLDDDVTQPTLTEISRLEEVIESDLKEDVVANEQPPPQFIKSSKTGIKKKMAPDMTVKVYKPPPGPEKCLVLTTNGPNFSSSLYNNSMSSMLLNSSVSNKSLSQRYKELKRLNNMYNQNNTNNASLNAVVANEGNLTSLQHSNTSLVAETHQLSKNQSKTQPPGMASKYLTPQHRSKPFLTTTANKFNLGASGGCSTRVAFLASKFGKVTATSASKLATRTRLHASRAANLANLNVSSKPTTNASPKSHNKDDATATTSIDGKLKTAELNRAHILKERCLHAKTLREQHAAKKNTEQPTAQKTALVMKHKGTKTPRPSSSNQLIPGSRMNSALAFRYKPRGGGVYRKPQDPPPKIATHKQNKAKEANSKVTNKCFPRIVKPIQVQKKRKIDSSIIDDHVEEPKGDENTTTEQHSTQVFEAAPVPELIIADKDNTGRQSLSPQQSPYEHDNDSRHSSEHELLNPPFSPPLLEKQAPEIFLDCITEFTTTNQGKKVNVTTKEIPNNPIAEQNNDQSFSHEIEATATNLKDNPYVQTLRDRDIDGRKRTSTPKRNSWKNLDDLDIECSTGNTIPSICVTDAPNKFRVPQTNVTTACSNVVPTASLHPSAASPYDPNEISTTLIPAKVQPVSKNTNSSSIYAKNSAEVGTLLTNYRLMKEANEITNFTVPTSSNHPSSSLYNHKSKIYTTSNYTDNHVGPRTRGTDCNNNNNNQTKLSPQEILALYMVNGAASTTQYQQNHHTPFPHNSNNTKNSEGLPKFTASKTTLPHTSQIDRLDGTDQSNANVINVPVFPYNSNKTSSDRFSNYDISDLRSDDSSDDESQPKKPKPYWAYGPSLKEAAMRQEFAPNSLLILKRYFVDSNTVPRLHEIFSSKRKKSKCKVPSTKNSNKKKHFPSPIPAAHNNINKKNPIIRANINSDIFNSNIELTTAAANDNSILTEEGGEKSDYSTSNDATTSYLNDTSARGSSIFWDTTYLE